MRGIKFITGHMVYSTAYNQILQAIETMHSSTVVCSGARPSANPISGNQGSCQSQMSDTILVQQSS